MTASFVAYIDESGDEGFQFEKGSSEWFVLSAVIVRKMQDLEVVKLVDKVRDILHKPAKKPLHFCNLKHEHRLPYVAEIAKGNLRTITILIHKPSIRDPENFQDRYRLYFYSVRLLIERLSWLCRDTKKLNHSEDGSVEIVFSNRSSMSYPELRDYLDHLEKLSSTQDFRINWPYIKTDKIIALPHHSRMGLQIADATAGSFRSAVQSTQLGFTEDRYAQMLKPVVYKRKGMYLGYGLKFWPQGVEDLLIREDDSSWVVDGYK